MPIYTATKVSSAKQVHALFKQRGIETHTHAPLSALHIHGVTHEKELAYDGYRSNIDVFIAATNF